MSERDLSMRLRPKHHVHFRNRVEGLTVGKTDVLDEIDPFM